MRKTLYLTTIFLITLISCSKKNETKPQSSQVTINGQVYSTVVIGNQTWTAVNYDGPGGIPVPNINENIYGKLYKWQEAQALTLPAGWRIPTQTDFENLLESQGNITVGYDGSASLETLGARHLRSQINWTLSGDNASGFSGEPAGDYNYNLKIFENTYAYATFWGSTFQINGLDPETQIVLTLAGYYSSPGTGHIPQEGAITNGFEAGGEICYSLRFVRDN